LGLTSGSGFDAGNEGYLLNGLSPVEVLLFAGDGGTNGLEFRDIVEELFVN
jgi:hypothetical protein